MKNCRIRLVGARFGEEGIKMQKKETKNMIENFALAFSPERTPGSGRT